MRNIYIYKNENESQVEHFFENADVKLKNKFKSILTYISNEKNPLCEPYVKHIAISKYKELYELRVKASGEMSRLIFTLSGDDIVLLYAFKKKCDRDNEKAFERAFKMSKLNEELAEVCI